MIKKISLLVGIVFFFVFISGINKDEITQADLTTLEFVALGDSITYGTGDQTKKGYIGWLEDKYNDETEYTLHVKNYGVPKHRTSNILEQLEQFNIQNSIKKADSLVLYVGTNDFRKSLNYDFDNIDLKLENDGKEQFSKNLDKILNNIRNVKNDLPIFILGLYHPYTNFDNHQQLGLLIEDWNLTIQEVIKPFDHIHYVSTFDIMASSPKKKLFSDDLHPNKKGHQLIAARLLNSVLTVEESVTLRHSIQE